MSNSERRARSIADLRRRAEDVERARLESTRWHGVDDDRWRRANEDFHRALAAMYPPQWGAVFTALQHGETTAVEPAIEFLEADVRCFRSGYQNELLCRYLGRITLTDQQRRRLLIVAGSAAADATRLARERRAFARLAVRLS